MSARALRYASFIAAASSSAFLSRARMSGAGSPFGPSDTISGLRSSAGMGRLLPSEAAEACKEILRPPAEARARALRGKEFVRRNFLMPRLLRDWLALFNVLLGDESAGEPLVRIGAAGVS